MNKKTIIICALLATAAFAFGGCGTTNDSPTKTAAAAATTASAASNSDSGDSEVDSFEAAEQAKKAEIEKEAERQFSENPQDNSSDNESLAEEFSKSLDELEKTETERNKNDILAYGIVAKEYGDKYKRTELVQDPTEDGKYIELMLDILDKKETSENDRSILKTYIKRRFEFSDWTFNLDNKLGKRAAIAVGYDTEEWLDSEEVFDPDLKAKFDKLREEEKEQIKEDLRAYPIVAKYFGDKYARDVIIDNFKDDEPYMKLMAELLNDKKTDPDESEILKTYLNRRLEGMEQDDNYGNAETEKLIRDTLENFK